MTFSELVKIKNYTGYSLSKQTGIPYMTINDLLNGKASFSNVTLSRAVKIANCLGVDVTDLLKFDGERFIEFRYFRSNTLHELKRLGVPVFIDNVLRSRRIDFYHKNGGKAYALYLLALIDYLSRAWRIALPQGRYNHYRKERLDSPFFVGSDLVHFSSVEEAEKRMGISVIPEFRRFNIIENDVFNVA